jgi:peptide deformylase
MSVLPILNWPDPRLSRICDPVTDVAEMQDLVADMFETMYAAPGRGLAAPQVGILRRVFVMDVGWKTGEKTPVVCINPLVVASSDRLETGTEGCLSIPGVTAEITRPWSVTLDYLDLDGIAQCETLDGAAAKCAQHEIDHLDGLVTFDRLDPAARAALMAEYEAS